MSELIVVPFEKPPPYHWIRPVVDEKTGEVWAYCDGPQGMFAPHKVGDRIPVREEWSVELVSIRSGKAFALIDYMDGQSIEFEIGSDAIRMMDEIGPDWQPSATMPDWAARQFKIATKVEVRDSAMDITEEECARAGFHGSYLPAYVANGEIIGPDGTLPREEYREWLETQHPGLWISGRYCWFFWTTNEDSSLRDYRIF